MFRANIGIINYWHDTLAYPIMTVSLETGYTTSATGAQENIVMARKNGTAEADAKPVTRKVVTFAVPVDFYATLETEAKAANTSVGDLIRQAVAQSHGVTLPKPTRGGGRRKYASKEERIAANKQKTKENREKLAAVMKLYESNPDEIQRLLSQAGINLPGVNAPAAA